MTLNYKYRAYQIIDRVTWLSTRKVIVGETIDETDAEVVDGTLFIDSMVAVVMDGPRDFTYEL